jgi:hypothetical protein
MGNVPWSPELQLIMNRIDYYQRCRLKYIWGCQINSRTLLKFFKKAKMITPATSAEEAIEGLRQEFKNYNILKKTAKQKRWNFIEHLAEIKALEGNNKKERILKQLILHESQRSTSRNIKGVLGKYRQGVTAIEVPVANGEWELRTKK